MYIHQPNLHVEALTHSEFGDRAFAEVMRLNEIMRVGLI